MKKLVLALLSSMLILPLFGCVSNTTSAEREQRFLQAIAQQKEQKAEQAADTTQSNMSAFAVEPIASPEVRTVITEKAASPEALQSPIPTVTPAATPEVPLAEPSAVPEFSPTPAVAAEPPIQTNAGLGVNPQVQAAFESYAPSTFVFRKVALGMSYDAVLYSEASSPLINTSFGKTLFYDGISEFNSQIAPGNVQYIFDRNGNVTRILAAMPVFTQGVGTLSIEKIESTINELLQRYPQTGNIIYSQQDLWATHLIPAYIAYTTEPVPAVDPNAPLTTQQAELAPAQTTPPYVATVEPVQTQDPNNANQTAPTEPTMAVLPQIDMQTAQSAIDLKTLLPNIEQNLANGASLRVMYQSQNAFVIADFFAPNADGKSMLLNLVAPDQTQQIALFENQTETTEQTTDYAALFANPVLKTTSTALSVSYDENALAADYIALDQAVQITGRIAKIYRNDQGQPVMELEQSPGDVFAVTCLFEEKDIDQLIQLKKGGLIHIVGIGSGLQSEKIVLSACQIVS